MLDTRQTELSCWHHHMSPTTAATLHQCLEYTNQGQKLPLARPISDSHAPNTSGPRASRKTEQSHSGRNDCHWLLSTQTSARSRATIQIRSYSAPLAERPAGTFASRADRRRLFLLGSLSSEMALPNEAQPDMGLLADNGSVDQGGQGTAEEAKDAGEPAGDGEANAKDKQDNEDNEDNEDINGENKKDNSGDEDPDDDDDDDDGDDDDDDEDDGVVRCVCGERNDGELMIQCEICQIWQHTLCMGIRDEAHIPDKYYCEKCRPEDHPYISSRPRTVVLAEASALGVSTMMRRSAVMAVAKMTAREEYRAASAAAAIAASVAAAATGTKPANGKRTPKKPARKTEDAAAAGTSPTSKAARKGRRSRRSTRGGADNDGPENSEEDYEDGGKQKDGSRTSSSPSGNANGTEDGSPTGAKRANSGSRKTQQTPRRSANPANGSRKRRRTTGRQSTGGTHEQGALESAEGEGEGDEGSDSDTDSGAAEDLVARMMGVKQEPKGKAKSRLPKSRTRSVSTIVKGSVNRSSAELMQDGLGLASALGSPRGRIGGGSSSSNSKLDFQMDASEARRGHSVPGSPRQLSPSPSLQSLLYSSVAAAIADGKFDAGGSSKADKLCKRKRAGGSVRNTKRQRMTVSATNSPYVGDGGGFATFGGSNPSFQQQRSKDAKSAAVAAAAADKAGGDQDDDDEEEEEEEESHSTADDKVEGHGGNQRQPKHNFPPQEMMDVDGNIILVSSHMLNSQGKPIYSSISPETMCKIRYPHSKASIYELNRRAKQLLEWLGKTQSEYEHERMSWLLPSPVLTAAAAAEVAIEGEEAHESPLVAAANGALGCAPVAGRQYSQQLSEAPTSPINPNDWPNDDTADDCEIVFKDRGASCFDELVGSQRRQQQPAALEKAHPRDTRSIMEGLMSRLIQFQEMYSS